MKSSIAGTNHFKDINYRHMMCKYLMRNMSSKNSSIVNKLRSPMHFSQGSNHPGKWRRRYFKNIRYLQDMKCKCFARYRLSTWDCMQSICLFFLRLWDRNPQDRQLHKYSTLDSNFVYKRDKMRVILSRLGSFNCSFSIYYLMHLSTEIHNMKYRQQMFLSRLNRTNCN